MLSTNINANGHEQVFEQTAENLVFKQGRIDLKTVTLASGALELKRGTLLHYANGKYSATGSNAAAILAEDVKADEAGDVVAKVYLSGTFNAEAIIGTVDEAAKQALRAVDVYVEYPAA